MDQLLSTVKVVAAGEMRVPPEVVRRVFAGIRSGAKTEEEAGQFTPMLEQAEETTGTKACMTLADAG